MKIRLFYQENVYFVIKQISSCFRRSQTFIADERIRQSAIHKDDKRILALAADELIAKEAVYHKSCYR